MLFTQMSNFWPDLRCSGQTAWNGGQSPATVVKGYFRNANRHDVKGMLRYCSNDFVFRDERSQFRMTNGTFVCLWNGTQSCTAK
jgi:hypothetical protein